MKKCLLLLMLLALLLTLSANAYAARLFWADTETDTIYDLDPDTGAILNSFSAPDNYVADCSGLAFASDRLFFYACDEGSQQPIIELHPVSGAVVNTIPYPEECDGLGFSGTELYVLDYEASLIYVLNPNTGGLIRTLDPGVDLIGGISYAGGRNSIFATDTDTEPATIYELNASTGAVINSFDAPSPEIYGVGYSFERGTLFLGNVPGEIRPPNGEPSLESAPGQSDSNYAGRQRISDGGHTIYEVNPNTGAVIGSLPISPVWALASDEAGESGPSANIPTMNEWGMIIFMALAGIGAVFYIRRMDISA